MDINEQRAFDYVINLILNDDSIGNETKIDALNMMYNMRNSHNSGKLYIPEFDNNTSNEVIRLLKSKPVDSNSYTICEIDNPHFNNVNIVLERLNKILLDLDDEDLETHDLLTDIVTDLELYLNGDETVNLEDIKNRLYQNDLLNESCELFIDDELTEQYFSDENGISYLN